jgi:hypothetical protein
MFTPIRLARQVVIVAAAGFALAACAGKPASEMPAAAAAPASTTASPAAQPKAAIDVHEASAQCWMKYDKSTASLDARAKLVDKCIDEKMKGK